MKQSYAIGPAGQVTAQIPAAHIDVNVPFTTISAVMVDITGMVVTVTSTIPCKLLLAITGDWNATGGGSATAIGYCVNVDGVDEDEQHMDFAASDTDSTGAIVHITAVLAAGSHTVKARMRRISGSQTAQFTSGMLTAIALQA